MDIGLALPQYDYSLPGQQPLDWPTIVAWAQRAEQAGFGSLWLSDHLFLSLERYGGSGRPLRISDELFERTLGIKQRE